MSTAQEDQDSLKPPKNTLGFHQLYPDNETHEASVDVVAIHGLGGDSFSTWTTPGAKPTLWLRDLLKISTLYKDARVLTFGYDATAFLHPFEKESSSRTFTFAQTLLSDLLDLRSHPREHNRPIIFVGHSLGGIVIKSALRHAYLKRDLYGSILDSTEAIVFFGTPHQGANAAVWASYLGSLGKLVRIRSTKVVGELQTWSDHLVELTSEFCEIASRFQLHTYYETKRVNGIKVVEEGSARIGLPHEIVASLEADHISICKFDTEDPNWHRVLRRFETIAKMIARKLETVLPVLPHDLKNFGEARIGKGRKLET